MFVSDLFAAALQHSDVFLLGVHPARLHPDLPLAVRHVRGRNGWLRPLLRWLMFWWRSVSSGLSLRRAYSGRGYWLTNATA